MNLVIKDFEKYTDDIQDELRRHVRILLSVQHIFERKDKSIYQFITNTEYFTIIRKILDASGYEIRWINSTPGNGLIGIVPMPNISFHKIRYQKRDLMKVIICLHKIYSEQRYKDNVDEESRVRATLDDVAGILGCSGQSHGKSLSSILRQISEDMKIIEDLKRESEDHDDMRYRFMINESVLLYVSDDFINKWNNVEHIDNDGEENV